MLPTIVYVEHANAKCSLDRMRHFEPLYIGDGYFSEARRDDEDGLITQTGLASKDLSSPSHSDMVGRMYLKRWPVHMHLRAVVVTEPLEVLLGVGPQDGTLQFPVHCGIADRERERASERERQRERQRHTH